MQANFKEQLMQQPNPLITAAFSDFQGLLDIHLRFIEEIEKHAEDQSSTSSLKVQDGNLLISYLDCKLSATRRTVAINSKLVANEYAFGGTTFDKDKCILLCIYLTSNGILFLDPSLTNRLCDYDNQYVVKKILSEVQLAALSSCFFSPRPNLTHP